MSRMIQAASGVMLAILADARIPFLARAQGTVTLPPEVRASLLKNYGAEARHMSASTDLNGEGRAEVIVYLVGPGVCGSGGCPAVIYTPSTAGYRVVTRTSVTQTPIYLSPRSSHGWRNLIVGVSGGGVKAGSAELEFNGKSYPRNPTVAPARPVKDLAGATILIREMKGFEDANPLATVDSGGAVSGKPSFDCAKAASTSEKLICSDAELAAADRKMAGIYEQAIKRWTADGIAPQQRTTQRNWVQSRNRCGASKVCLGSSYQRRIAELQIQSGQLTAPKPVDYTCKGSKNPSLGVSFYNQTNPPSAVLTLGSDKQVIALVAPSGSGARYTAPNVEILGTSGRSDFEVVGDNAYLQPSTVNWPLWLPTLLGYQFRLLTHERSARS